MLSQGVASSSSTFGGRNSLGTFLGVFVPTLSTILGVVIFLRVTEILGQLGFYNTVGVFTSCFVVALLTTLSICALVSVDGNTAADGGGLYTAVFKATNRHFGTIAGCLIYVAYVCGIAFYCMGFGEATKMVIVGDQNLTQLNIFTWNTPGSWIVVVVSSAATVFLAAFVLLVGAFRSVVVTVGILMVIVMCLVTAWAVTLAAFGNQSSSEDTGFDINTLKGNLPFPLQSQATFQMAFAAVFPGFTGIISGANLSGELKNAVVSITRGTLFALITAFVLYLGESFVAASSIPNITLQNPNNSGIFQLLVDNTIHFPITYIGILCTTISSALSYMLGAPRLVEAMARDGVIPKVFGLRYGPAKEPAVALLITAVLVLCVILTGDLNLLAPLVTAIFLLTFCLLNIVCVSMTCSSPGGSRKRIKFSCYSPWTALFGAISSLAAMIFCATAEALVIMALVGCIVCALNWRGLREWCRNTSSRASPRSADAKRGSRSDDLMALEDGGISEAIIKPVVSASITESLAGGESSSSDSAAVAASAAAVAAAAAVAGGGHIDSEQLTPEQRARKQASDEAMIKLMSIVHAQDEAEQQPQNAWVRAWFPCVKAKKRPRRQTSRPLESPLLFNEHEGSINGHAGDADADTIDGDDDDGIEETDDEAYIRLHGRYITLAASRVRDAIAYKYRSSDWGSMRKLSAKRFFHQTKFFRSLVMVLWFLLAFVEVPSWCFQDPALRNDFSECLKSVPNFGIPLLKKQASFALDFFCLAVIGGELFLKIRFSGKQSFRGNRWYILQIVLIACYVTSFLVTYLVPTCPVNLCPLIRPLYFVAWSRRVRDGFVTLVRTLPKLGGVVLLLVVHILLFATLGMICFKSTEEEANFDDLLAAIMSLIVLLTTANFPDVMMKGYAESRATAIFFIVFLIIGHLFIMNLILATVVNSYQTEFAAKNDRKKQNATKSLDMAFAILDFDRCGVVDPRALELLYSELRKHRLSLFKVSEEGQGRVHRDFEQMQDVTREQFGLLVEAMSAHRIGLADDDDEDDAELEDGGLEVTEDNNNSNGDAGDAPQSGTLSCNSLARQCPQFRLRLRRIFRSKAYKLCLNLFHGLTAIFSLVEAEIINNYGDNLSDLLGMEYAQLIVTVVLAVDMVLKSFAMGCVPFWRSKRMAFDGVMICLCLLLDVVFVGPLSTLGEATTFTIVLGIITISRLLRSTRILYSIKTTRAILQAALRLVPAFVQLFGMMWAAVSFYAFVGISAFGGIINYNNTLLHNTTFAADDYWANNFNDLASALVTLFELLMVNNWHVIMDGCTAASGTEWSRLFFVSFWLITVVIMTNIVVASIIEGFFNTAALKQFKRLESQARQDFYKRRREARLSVALSTFDADAPSRVSGAETARESDSRSHAGIDVRRGARFRGDRAVRRRKPLGAERGLRSARVRPPMSASWTNRSQWPRRAPNARSRASSSTRNRAASAVELVSDSFGSSGDEGRRGDFGVKSFSVEASQSDSDSL